MSEATPHPFLVSEAVVLTKIVAGFLKKDNNPKKGAITIAWQALKCPVGYIVAYIVIPDHGFRQLAI